MKKLICIILGLFLFTCSYGQAIINRSGPANTVQDARWMSQYNAFLPRYNDTTAANLQKGIDSCGAIIFTYDIAALWFRSCSNGSKQWVQILPAGSPTPGGQAWVNPINVNLFTDASLNASIGTFGANGMYWKTNNTTRLYLDRNGIAPETGTSVGIGIDPADSNRVTYFSGGGGATPTWQQTLDVTNGKVLTGNNVIDGNQFNFEFNGGGGGNEFVIQNYGSVSFQDEASSAISVQNGISLSQSTGGGHPLSIITLNKDSIVFRPNSGSLYIDTLNNETFQNTLMGWTSTSGTNRGKVGYITIGSGLSLSSGVLSGSGAGWELTGNSGTTAGTNFIGTTDGQDLVLKRNSTEGLRLASGKTTVTGNLELSATSSSSTGVIYKGSDRFIHDFKLSGTSGDNLFIGKQAGNFSMTGSTGIQGSYNVAVGVAAMSNNTTGLRCTAVGTYAMQNNTTGVNNTAVGQNALATNTTGYNNAVVGGRAAAFGSPHDVAAVGFDAASRTNNAAYIAAVGTDALYNAYNSMYAVAIGDSTLWKDSVGVKNTAVGSRAGYYLGDTYPNFSTQHDNYMTFLGADASRDSSISNQTGLTNSTAIGYNAKVYASNQVSIGNSNTTTTLLRGNVGIGTTAPTQLLSLGTAGSTSGIFNIAGSTSGTITFQPQAAAGTYNWNWPTTAGTSGYLLTSGGGGSTAMTWTDPATIPAALTSTYIGYGSGSNTLTGDANLTYTPASSAVVLDSGYLSFTGNKDFGSSVTGSIFKSSLYGLTFRGVPGASYDMLFFTQGGSTLFANPTGTTKMGTVGDWGFGLLGSTISAKVHITAGTASAGTAPLKFNAGTNLTSPEAGAMEWNGTNLFITQTTGPTRQTIAYASDLTFWNLNGTSTLTGGVTIDGSGVDYDLKGNKSGINIASRVTTIGDYLAAGSGTKIIVDESNDKLFMISAAISGATTGDALTVVDPSTGEIGVAPNLAFMLRKDSTDMYTSNGRIFVKDAAGNRTQISPHNDKGEWIYRSTDKDGVTTEINMIRLAELLEKVTGEKLIYKTKE